MKYTFLILLILLMISTNSFTQTSIKAVYASNAPTIDGRLDEDTWKDAAIIDQLYQREPNRGEPVSEKTIIYVCYDADHLYVGMKCFDAKRLQTAPISTCVFNA